MNNEQQPLELLSDAVLEGDLGEGELESFRELLRGNEAARKAYAEQMQIHALLTWQHGRAAVPASVVLAPMEFQAKPESAPLRRPKLRRLFQGLLAAAAALVMLLGFAFWQMDHRNRQGLSADPPKGVWVDVLATSGSPYAKGQRMALERLEVKSGSLRFRLSSGAVVDLEGPVSLEFVDPMRMKLLRGSINMDVGNDAKGFVVETPSASVLDIGTRFSLSVGNDGDTEIAVFEGEVEVYRAGTPLTRETRLASLVEGEAARMSARDVELQRLNMTTLRGGRLQIRGLNAPDDPVVLNVSDNVRSARFHRCYAVEPGGMAEGALASLTRVGHARLKWRAVPGQDFPAELEGADAISSFQFVGDELVQSEISLELARPCAVYVLFDHRAAAPEWLRRDFRDTGLRLRSGPWSRHAGEITGVEADADGKIHLTHSVWRRDVLSAGMVKLGPTGIPGQPYAGAMYGIAVKALE